MNIHLEEEYYIITGVNSEEAVDLIADKQTHKLNYGFEYLISGRPLFFTNADKDRNRSDGLNEYGVKEKIANIMFRSSEFIVSTQIRDLLIKFDITAVQYFPAIFVDVDDNYHDYWFVNVYEEFDWCDIDRSVLDEFADEEIALGSPPEAEKIALNFHEMLQIEEEKRLIFKIGNISNNKIYIHKKIKDILEPIVGDNVRFYRVDQYKAFMEFRNN
jgi:hypothetical protein